MESIDVILQKTAKKTQPRVAAVIGVESTEYFVLCENQVLCKVPTLRVAIFTSFSAYYCFNLEYPPNSKNIFYFMQDFVLGHPDSGKKSGLYLAVISDINRNI